VALLKIARMGHPVLRRPAAAVADARDPALARLVEDMAETMADAVGVGLAAPQVHVSSRLIVFRVPPARRQEGEPEAPEGLTALVNPVFEPIGEEMVAGLEGCLSIPGLRGIVPRHARIRYRGVTLDGRPLERIAEGFHARVVQHEIDHLDGVLFLDRMEGLETLVFESELHHLVGGGDAEEG
jgi:peptide deformylase